MLSKNNKKVIINIKNNKIHCYIDDKELKKENSITKNEQIEIKKVYFDELYLTKKYFSEKKNKIDSYRKNILSSIYKNNINFSEDDNINEDDIIKIKKQPRLYKDNLKNI
jgi:hypothetical protein